MKTMHFITAISAMLLGASTTLGGMVIDIDLTDINNWDAQGDSDNTVLDLDLGSDMIITGFGYNATLSTFGESWVSEASISIADAGDDPGFVVTPGAGMNAPGTDVDLTSGGIIQFSSIGLDNIVLDSGTARLEFFESFDDMSDEIDSTWTGGTLSLQVIPTPAALALYGFAGLARTRRRRSA